MYKVSSETIRFITVMKCTFGFMITWTVSCDVKSCLFIFYIICVLIMLVQMIVFNCAAYTFLFQIKHQLLKYVERYS